MFFTSQLRLRLALWATACAMAAPAATLEQLTLDQMAEKATAIVRATVSGSYTSVEKGTVYTHYKLRSSETWKGTTPAELMVPGGAAGRFQQSFPGVPTLRQDAEYVLFLWKSSTGITHLLGLSQGLFEIAPQISGALATRAKIGEMMLDASGKKVADRAISISLTDLRAKVRDFTGTGSSK